MRPCSQAREQGAASVYPGEPRGGDGLEEGALQYSSDVHTTVCVAVACEDGVGDYYVIRYARIWRFFQMALCV
jgi:hypothetical protein